MIKVVLGIAISAIVLSGCVGTLASNDIDTTHSEEIQVAKPTN
jgi:PBP1b-binding outer membrane lipoprotein LpoB